MSDKAKKAMGAMLLLAGLVLAFEAVTHAPFYEELERLNMDNHQH